MKVRVAVIGGGPAGLMAADVLAGAGVPVHVFDAMPSVGRKFLLAGIGGMNITHAEPFERFVERYRERTPRLQPLLEDFGPDALREWIHEFGVETFVGSSGRVFPREMKAAPLLRRWLRRLREAGVTIHTRHRWHGWNADKSLRFRSPKGEVHVDADVVVLALGGGSWPRLGSDAAWVPWLRERGVTVHSLVPANCGFEVSWSEHFSSRFAGTPVKPVVASCDAGSREIHRRGEFVITEHGVEGSLVYALSAELRELVARQGFAVLHLDLAPDRSQDRLARALSSPRGSRSLAEHLRRRTGVAGVAAGLLREYLGRSEMEDAASIAAAIKRLPLRLGKPRPLEEAISSAGGVAFEDLDDRLMALAVPGVFCAGEMLDWEAPTGGYLLTACFATGYRAGHGALAFLDRNRRQVHGALT